MRTRLILLIVVFGCSPTGSNAKKTELNRSDERPRITTGSDARVADLPELNSEDPSKCVDNPVKVNVLKPADAPYTCKGVTPPCLVARSLAQSPEFTSIEMVIIRKETADYRTDATYRRIATRAREKNFDLVEVLPDGHLVRFRPNKTIFYYCVSLQAGALQLQLAMRKAF